VNKLDKFPDFGVGLGISRETGPMRLGSVDASPQIKKVYNKAHLNTCVTQAALDYNAQLFIPLSEQQFELYCGTVKRDCLNLNQA
jgi:hypothetical protein